MLLINRKALITLMVFFSLLFVGCAANKETVSIKKTVDIQEWKTKNGARVLYVCAPELPMVDIQAVFDAGSVRDGNKKGIAKLANGLLSHGAKLDGKILTVDDISESFENVGARFGASASKDNAEVSLRTLTDEKLLSKAVATMQAVVNAPTFDQKEFERVRKKLMVAFEGRKQSPGTIASETFYQNLYGNHPYASPSIGLVERVKNLTRDDFVAFYKKYYVASNALVTIVGDVDKAKAAELAEQVVGDLPVGEKAINYVCGR